MKDYYVVFLNTYSLQSCGIPYIYKDYTKIVRLGKAGKFIANSLYSSAFLLEITHFISQCQYLSQTLNFCLSQSLILKNCVRGLNKELQLHSEPKMGNVQFQDPKPKAT